MWGFSRHDNAWLAADRRERLKNFATILIFAACVAGGIVAVILSVR
jgi:hypothetical protein